MASPGASRREATRQEVAKRDGDARHRVASCAGTGRRQEKGGQVGWAAQVGCTVLGCGWLPGKLQVRFLSSVFYFCFLFFLFSVVCFYLVLDTKSF